MMEWCFVMLRIYAQTCRTVNADAMYLTMRVHVCKNLSLRTYVRLHVFRQTRFVPAVSKCICASSRPLGLER